VAMDNLKLELLGSRVIKVKGNIKSSVVVKKTRAISAIQNCAIVTPVDPATRPSMMFYIVQPGDTLWKVARKYQTTVETLLRANQLSGPERIEPGRKLLIPKRLYQIK
ncbi:MAG TPA: LysM peptidoglycan-binding domain-containing protein, partial [Bacillota bacterium]|nr:LysM peptidoglycan-binding domain-containing protein [Bacillota bacterium]